MASMTAEDLTPDTAEFILEVADVRKAFPGVVALDNVQLKVRPGTVHALMGENGAGKSTLMKIIAGVYIPDQGEVRLKGQPLALQGPLDALEAGIAMIHQELNLMPFMTIAENIWIRREPINAFGMINHDKMNQMTEALFDRLGIDMDPEMEVRKLTVAGRQMIEIAKAVSFDSEVLIMDEPTSSLADREVEHLFRIINDLRAQGKGIIYITHKMDEVFEIADDISIFRDGQFIHSAAASDITSNEIIKLMVGREVTQMFPKEEVPISDVVLSVENLCLEGVFENISFEVRAGEILGFAGLVGSGRTNIAETLFGVTPPTSGSISIDGKKEIISSPHQAMLRGLALLTEDRKETGLFLGLSVIENMELAVLRDGYTRATFVEQNRLDHECDSMKERLQVKTPSMEERIGNLSGGNQQKVLIGRWLLTKPRILILDEPTRGIDVGAKAEIHKLITELVKQGVAVIMISSELPEVLGMSDRIMVMHQGRVTGFLNRSEANQVNIMELASSPVEMPVIED
ncbi:MULTISPECIES: sugar ABC transporter ATP-binding protein [Halomonadaceae]|uniref:Ribose/galactose/methyl galactoside import ATP-binding protein n=1 Tax=Vreelandella titanicae TaxID=664683 RepID=A0AAP9T1Q9_9GAMM|nr:MULTISPECIES: sugar ABC transporter ATP-binding protein [Halomonas]QKS25655.1 Galactose/methyl galactoside import ATP-binding protein MglA [Halomonas titanicae]CDG53148.1 putative sugar transporter subunit: ATP-binding component of ABC superfamily [Halomonas sp. A3H3]